MPTNDFERGFTFAIAGALTAIRKMRDLAGPDDVFGEGPMAACNVHAVAAGFEALLLPALDTFPNAGGMAMYEQVTADMQEKT